MSSYGRAASHSGVSRVDEYYHYVYICRYISYILSIKATTCTFELNCFFFLTFVFHLRATNYGHLISTCPIVCVCLINDRNIVITNIREPWPFIVVIIYDVFSQQMFYDPEHVVANFFSGRFKIFFYKYMYYSDPILKCICHHILSRYKVVTRDTRASYIVFLDNRDIVVRRS